MEQPKPTGKAASLAANLVHERFSACDDFAFPYLLAAVTHTSLHAVVLHMYIAHRLRVALLLMCQERRARDNPLALK